MTEPSSSEPSPQNSAWWRRKGNVAFAFASVLLVLAFAFLVIIRWREPLALDQGLFACFGRWVPRGWLPYRDLFEPKPPLFLYTFALGFSLGGSTQSIWAFEAVCLGLTMAAFGVATARTFGRWAGLLAAAFLFLGLWSPGFGGYWSRAQAEEFAALPSLACALLAWEALRRPRLAFATGVALGISGLIKIPTMGLGGAWVLFWLIRLGVRATLPRLLYLAAGIALPWSAAFIWFGLHGAGEDLVAALFPLPAAMHALSNSRGWLATIAVAAATLTKEVPWLVIPAILGCVLWARKSAERATWLACWMVFAFASVVAQRQLNGYHFLFAIPALAVAAGVGCHELTQEIGAHAGRRRLLALAGMIVVLGSFAFCLPGWWRGYQPSARLLWDGGDRQRLLEPFTVGTFSPKVEEALAAYLRANTRPEDGILIWGLAPGVYALADRHPVTKYPLHKVLLTEAPLSRLVPGLAQRRKDLVERMRQDPPAYFVLGQNDPNGFDWDESRISLLRFPQLSEIVRTQYRAETNIGHFLLFRRIR